MIDRRRQVGTGKQATLLAHLDGDAAGIDRGQDLARQGIWNHTGGGSIEYQRGGIRGSQPIVQAVGPEIGDGGHIDQHLRDYHQRNG